ncbi:autotransporter assembly complex protein TamA [Marinobacter caseinilyticus]|uniref:autotransporter assembly complex protein TamA n=1 Tax=Marinobacter caseinilyticus TaxID=2692195 RepID=UPI001A9491B4|nr:autotransporter assembly complex family protein [Marinobacter caseinilyticus]
MAIWFFSTARVRRWLCGALWLLLLLPLAGWGQVSVRVQGDYPALQQNAEAFIGTVEGRSADSLRRYASTATDQIKQALRALGYYRPQIQWRVIAEDMPRLELTVEPGEPVRIESRVIEIRGPAADDAEFGTVPYQRLAVGEVLNHGDYNSVRQTISNRALRLGYFDGEFTARRLEVDPDAGTANIELIYQSGERFRLGDVSFREGHGFEDELLHRFVTFEPGSLYHADKLARLNGDLSNSGYFSQVFIDAGPDDARGNTIPVEVRLTRRDPRSVAAGIGFSTDVGPRFRGTWTEHWVNPMGHRRGAETELSAPRQSLSAWYELPLDPPMSDSIRFTAGYQHEDIEDVESERLTLGQQWQHALDNGWQRLLSLRWEAERYQLGQQDSETSRLLLPGIGYSKLSADSPLDPTRGYRLQLDVSGAHRSALSDADILHVVGLARGLITLGDDHRFLGRVQVGGIATNQFSDVPPSLRFFAGGDQSVRGYGYETLSPEDDNGDTVGGRYLLAAGIEYQYSLSQTWRLAAFVDEGNAVNDLFDPLATGVGVGVRWVSPVGPLRLDIAKGLDPEFGGGWRLHFSMGPEL